jgi:outer membrane protein assembly factor BamB
MVTASRRLAGMAALVICGSLAGLSEASDWPRFRGPNGSGISPDSAPTPTSWSPTENLKWKAELPGAGVSCPIVVGDRVFVTCYSGYGVNRRDPGSQEDLKRHLVCVNRATGKIEWTKSYDAVLPEDPFAGAGVPEHGYASHTPVSDGERVYVFFGKSGAYAFDLTGNELWHTKLGKGSDPRQWGSSSSPIVFEKTLIVCAGPESGAVVGLDKTTGKELWRADADTLGNVWGTPVAVKVDDSRTDIVLGAPGEIWGLNPENGKLKWYCEAMQSDQFNSSVVASDGVVYAIEGRGGGSIAVKVGGKDDVTKSNVVWSGRDSSRFGTPVVYEGRIYFFSNGIANCIDAKTGEKIYQSRMQGGRAAGAPGGDGPPGGGRPGRGGRGGGSDYSSAVLADGKIYYTTRSGDTHVLKAGTTFEELAVNRVTEDAEDFSATPAISDGQLFFRSNKNLYCVGK